MVEWAPPSGSCQFSTSLDFSCLLTFQETLKDQEVGLTHASFKLLLLPWVLKYMRFFVSLLQDSLCFPQPTGSPESQMFWGLVFPVQDPQAWELIVGLWHIAPWGEPRQLLEKDMAAHSSILACRIPWTGEPGRLPSLGSQGVRNDWLSAVELTSCLWVAQLGMGLCLLSDCGSLYLWL